MTRKARPILIVLGILSIIYSFITFSISGNFLMGHFMMICLGIVFVLWGFFFEFVTNKAKWINYVLVTGLAIFFGYLLFIGVYGSVKTTPYNEKAVIVLGAGLRGKNPSKQLRFRLDAAILYHENNPDAVIVVSGGQGENEEISEAEAMKMYLVSNGVPEDMIIMEDKSVSTETNFKNSKEILDGIFGQEYDVCYITNDFHVFRAGFQAKKAGFNGKINHLGAKHSLLFTMIDFPREFAAIVSYCFSS